MVRTAGLEPALPSYGKRILSPLRLPFRHVRMEGGNQKRITGQRSSIKYKKFSKTTPQIYGITGFVQDIFGFSSAALPAHMPKSEVPSPFGKDTSISAPLPR